MKATIKVLAGLLGLTLASIHVVAAAHHSSNSYLWSEAGTTLSLQARDGGPVVVERVTPSTLHGLKAGDVIVSIDGRPVARLGDLLDPLRRHGTTDAVVEVRRAGALVALRWTPADCKAISPLPPAPPAPPTAP